MNQAVIWGQAVIVCKSGWGWVPWVPVEAGRGVTHLQQTSPELQNNLPLLPCRPSSRHLISTFQAWRAAQIMNKIYVSKILEVLNHSSSCPVLNFLSIDILHARIASEEPAHRASAPPPSPKACPPPPPAVIQSQALIILKGS